MPHKDKEKRREWREKNKDRIAAKQREYREKNRERIAAKKREWCEQNKEHLAARNRAYYEANKEYVNSLCRTWREENKERSIAYRRARWQRLPDSNIVGALKKTGFPAQYITPELVETRRLSILIKRELKEQVQA